VNQPRPTRAASRGTALLTVMVMMAVLLAFVIAILAYAQHRRSRAVQLSRSLIRTNCAQAGLELAKDYFGRNFVSSGHWSTYLSQPNLYNPTSYTTWTGYTGPSQFADAGFQTANPQLFADLDGDGRPDVYIYVRDNADELPPISAQNWALDNDQNAFVGAICVSQTMIPRLESGTLDSNQLYAEGLLSYNMQSNYKGQAGGGSSGNGNLNN
jgi:hypothetical protein